MQAGQSDRSIAQIAELAKVAVRHLQQSQFAEALDAFQRLIAVRPDNADDWFNLGYLHRCLRQFHPSLDAYQRALTLGVSQPEEVHVNRARLKVIVNIFGRPTPLELDFTEVEKLS